MLSVSDVLIEHIGKKKWENILRKTCHDYTHSSHQPRACCITIIVVHPALKALRINVLDLMALRLVPRHGWNLRRMYVLLLWDKFLGTMQMSYYVIFIKLAPLVDFMSVLKSF